jgi:hypothetical protein
VINWQPILDGENALRARAIAADIAESVSESLDPFALLLDAYIAKELHSDRHAERALTALERLVERAQARGPGLYGGLSGVGFVAQHISTELALWIEADDEDSIRQLDTSLIEVVREYPVHGSYDLIGGLAGVATYAIERLPRDSARELLGLVVDQLGADAECVPSGIAWHTKPELLPERQRRMAPLGYYNLGVAHGIPAIAVVLAHAASQGVRDARALELLDGTIRWIAAQQAAAGEGARFPAWIPVGGRSESGVREAWCYGGLGLSVALLQAARLTKNERWEAMALDFARLEATRSKDRSGVIDVSLCHGAAGNAHLYARLYASTGEEPFLAAAHKWLSHTLDEYKPSIGIGGFLFWKAASMAAPSEQTWLRDDSFLSGSAGVGLALLAASSANEPKWDRLLGADIPDTSVRTPSVG